MRLENIKVAQNGFVIEDAYGNLHIAHTLLEAARLAGEAVPDSGRTEYDTNRCAADLDNVKCLVQEGNKIGAIKLLRDCFTPRLALREAKDLVERLCS